MPHSIAVAPRAFLGAAARMRGGPLPRLLLSVTLAAAALSVACGEETTAPAFADPSRVAPAAGERLASLRWIDVAREQLGRNGPSQHSALRTMAYLTLAQAVAADSAMSIPGASRATVRGAVAAASVAVLGHVFPAEAPLLEGELRAEREAERGGRRDDYDAGMAAGRAVGGRAVARARGDGFGAVWTGSVPSGRGRWTPGAATGAGRALPMLGRMRPFFMASGGQFRPAAPPAFDSPEFRGALDEVRRVTLGRTPGQDSVVQRWAAQRGAMLAGVWGEVAAQRIARARLGELAATRALALANAAAMDAVIACHDAAYTYWLLRPSQADPSIAPTLDVPAFPSYPSSHACLSAAVAEVLGALFPEDRARLAGLAREAAESRVQAGIHYRFDAETGLAMGEQIGRLAVDVDRRTGVRALLR